MAASTMHLALVKQVLLDAINPLVIERDHTTSDSLPAASSAFSVDLLTNQKIRRDMVIIF